MKNTLINKRIVLASRPTGAPTTDNFRLEESTVRDLNKGEVCIQTHYLSLDPYMRGRMSDKPSYAAPVAIGETMVGSTVSKVIASQNDKFSTGDWVLSFSGWQHYAISNGSDLTHLGDSIEAPTLALGVMGMPGFTAYMGLIDIGKPQPGETLVVAAATGPVGSTVGQIGKIKGCQVVGIAGSDEKCRYAEDVLGFNTCINHHDVNLAAKLKSACPKGIDIYFENVGGSVFDAVMPLLNTSARIPLCGLVSQYNTETLPEGPNKLPLLMATLLVKRITIKGFIIFDDYGHRYPEFSETMQAWLGQGMIHHKEHIVNGLENAPSEFIGMLKGDNFGKLIIKMP